MHRWCLEISLFKFFLRHKLQKNICVFVAPVVQWIRFRNVYKNVSRNKQKLLSFYRSAYNTVNHHHHEIQLNNIIMISYFVIFIIVYLHIIHTTRTVYSVGVNNFISSRILITNALQINNIKWPFSQNNNCIHKKYT